MKVSSSPIYPFNLTIRLQKITAFSGAFVLILFLVLFLPGNSSAAISGICSDCHTMHNSQGGSEMATYGGGTGPNSFLTRGTCVGCHAQGSANNIVTVGTSQIPQVSHANSTDLAAGNFANIGTGGTSDNDSKGHNVIDLFGANSDGVLNAAPGVYMVHSGFLSDTYLTCAGTNGCHGSRQDASGTGIGAIKGAHHGNVDGQLTTADTIANSYRFLLGVKGLENTTDRWQNKSATSHNEYYGKTTPTTYACYSQDCHASFPAKPRNGTITDFCGTCHPDFHGTGNIGGDTSSPFTRHPTDIVIKNSGEYASYTSYSVEAPAGRPSVPSSMSGTVTPGTDVVTCLSCHFAHASDYDDMLRWDYSTMDVGGGGSGGCFTCHTEKN